MINYRRLLEILLNIFLVKIGIQSNRNVPPITFRDGRKLMSKPQNSTEMWAVQRTLQGEFQSKSDVKGWMARRGATNGSWMGETLPLSPLDIKRYQGTPA